MVRAERIRLEQVLVNVLGNALDALVDTPGPVIMLTVADRDCAIDLDIADNGPALPDAIAASLFQPFNSSKEDGLGLGLVISRDIMADFGGELLHLPSETRTTFRLRMVRP
jgi:two-component system C4-dicarboxylate transport sensor histidine kinase DctB